MCIGGTSQWPATLFRGIDQWGERYGYLLVDPIGGAIGAFSMADGINTGGQSRTPICQLPNIEHTEQSFPVLFLYRKECRIRAAPASIAVACRPSPASYRTARRSSRRTRCRRATPPTSTGMMGGYPATVNVYKFKRNTDIRQRLDNADLIGDMADVKGDVEELQLRQQNFLQHPGDVYSVIWTAAGGFGDPTERDPERVAKDVVENRAVSIAAAREIYGVVITADEKLDLPATQKLRAGLRQARRKKGGRVKALQGKVVRQLTDNLALRREAGQLHICCSKCAADLGPASGNYKDRAVRQDNDIRTANPNVGDYQRYLDVRPVFRQFYCPGCGALLENEIAQEGDAVLHDIELHIR
jgi:N-methylhydantoinase B